MSSFEEIIVPLWSITKLRADKEIGERLVKLKDLWKEKHYFSKEIEERFNMHIVEYKQVTKLVLPLKQFFQSSILKKRSNRKIAITSP